MKRGKEREEKAYGNLPSKLHGGREGETKGASREGLPFMSISPGYFDKEVDERVSR